MRVSKFGLVLSIVYLVITAFLFIDAFTCTSDAFCGFGAFVAVLPWPFILESFFSSPVKILDSTFGLFFFALLNLSILYFVGHYLERFVHFIWRLLRKTQV